MLSHSSSLRPTNRPPINRNRPTNQPLLLSSLLTGLLLPALTSHRPTNWPVTISSLLTGLRLITGPVLHLLTSNRLTNRPDFISSPLTDLRLITPVLLPAPLLFRSSKHQKLIWILVLIQILTLYFRNRPLVSRKKVKCRFWTRTFL